MSGIIADGTSGIVNIVLFRALETVYNHTKALIYTFEEKYEKNLRRGTENKKNREKNSKGEKEKILGKGKLRPPGSQLFLHLCNGGLAARRLP